MKFILEYNKYNKPSRGHKLSESEFRKILTEKCSVWLNNPKPLVRFTEKEGSDYELVEPKIHKRRSIDKNNYSNMLIDNLPSWSKFPKRSDSLMFFNRIHYSIDFGDYVNFVIPFDNTKFAVAPNADLYTSYNSVVDFRLAFDNDFSSWLHNIGSPHNYGEFSKYMNEEFVKPYFFNDIKSPDDEIVKLREYSLNSNHKTTMEYLNYLLAPENWESEYIHDGFKVMDYTNMAKVENGHKGVETWTDSNCLVISIGRQPDLTSIKEIFNDLITEFNSI